MRPAGIAASTLNIDIRFKYILFNLLHVGLTEEGRIGSARVAVARFLNVLRRIDATKERCAAFNRFINESCRPKPVANPSEYYFKSITGPPNMCAASRVDTSHLTPHTGPTCIEDQHEKVDIPVEGKVTTTGTVAHSSKGTITSTPFTGTSHPLR